jgi:hypothetical protein
MTGNSNGPGFRRWVLSGAGGLSLLLLAGLLFFGPPWATAGEPVFQGAAVQTTDHLLVSIALTSSDGKTLKGNLRAELLDADDTVIAGKEQSIQQTDRTGVYRFELPAVKQSLDLLKLRYSFGKHKLEVPLKKDLLVKAHETSLSTGTELHSGSTAALRCSIHGVKSITETVPLANASIEVVLKDAQQKVHKLFEGKADAQGTAAIRLQVPSLPAGNYKMVVETKSALGEEKLERDVKVKAEPKVLLVTDKPLYQPGQLIHIRALCLGAFDLKPVAESKLVFEVEDSKGNKVFKREQSTTVHGIAAVDFQLAGEVNQGEYKVRALLGDKLAEKSVTVKPYVLPKFKSNLTADRKFYAPGETIKSDLQVDYFFGKPVAGGKVKATASSFDVAFKDFQTLDTTTDEQGHVKFEIKLPDRLVGQPLNKGNALVKLEVKVTDKADHTETIARTYTVSSEPINVSLLPEAGQLVPGIENRVFVAALYPDGSPAKCEVQLLINKEIKDKFIGKKKTSASGLVEFVFTPDQKHFRPGPQQMFDVELLGGKQQFWGQKNLYDLKVMASDDRGAKVESIQQLSSDPFGANVLLRLDKAVYNGGDTMKLDVRSSAGMPTVYVDLVRDGQTLLTKWLDVKNGKAQHTLDLPAEASGTLEVHAYQMLRDGVIIRDSRVVYVQPANELKVNVKADKEVYTPGQEGKIRFEVTDQQGKPAAAALGVIIVDEAVYALQEMQPGLEKVYFTLQEELMKPHAQAVYRPNDSIDALVLEPALAAERQQVAQALLTAVRPKPPAAWNVDPTLGREQKFAEIIHGVKWSLIQRMRSSATVLVGDRKKGWQFPADTIKKAQEEGWVNPDSMTDPFGQPLSLETLAAHDPTFTPDNLARAITAERMRQLAGWITEAANNQKNELLKDGRWVFPDDWLSQSAKRGGWNEWLVDGWGGPIKFIKRQTKREILPQELERPTDRVRFTDKDKPRERDWPDEKETRAESVFDFHDLVSAGPDGKFDTEDDFRHGDPVVWNQKHLGDERWGNWPRWQRVRRERDRFGDDKDRAKDGGGGGGFKDKDKAADRPPLEIPKVPAGKEEAKPSEHGQGKSDGGGAPAVRLREYFPETMLWRPALVTDDKGVALLPVTFADSITTWRLTASASSAGGLLGGTMTPLRVFQDFFVDLDLPIALTKNDEVSFPVAVYNYLKTPQTVKLELIQEPWFELIDGGRIRSLDLKEGEVTSVKYRIRAKKVGSFPLTVKAFGSKMSDAIKRVIEVVPDGQMKEQVVNQQLAGKSTHTLVIPHNAIPDASKLMVKVYPGVFSQVLEGVEGLIRLPGG